MFIVLAAARDSRLQLLYHVKRGHSRAVGQHVFWAMANASHHHSPFALRLIPIERRGFQEGFGRAWMITLAADPDQRRLDVRTANTTADQWTAPNIAADYVSFYLLFFELTVYEEINVVCAFVKMVTLILRPCSNSWAQSALGSMNLLLVLLWGIFHICYLLLAFTAAWNNSLQTVKPRQW